MEDRQLMRDIMSETCLVFLLMCKQKVDKSDKFEKQRIVYLESFGIEEVIFQVFLFNISLGLETVCSYSSTPT